MNATATNDSASAGKPRRYTTNHGSVPPRQDKAPPRGKRRAGGSDGDNAPSHTHVEDVVRYLGVSVNGTIAAVRP